MHNVQKAPYLFPYFTAVFASDFSAQSSLLRYILYRKREVFDESKNRPLYTVSQKNVPLLFFQ